MKTTTHEERTNTTRRWSRWLLPAAIFGLCFGAARLPAAEVARDSAEAVQTRISRRFQDPQYVRFVSSLSADQALALYTEASQLIDQRHLAPVSYKERTEVGLKNVMEALSNPAFLQANRVSPQNVQVGRLRQALRQSAGGAAAGSLSAATHFIRWVMDTSSQMAGLSPAVVAMEFVNGATEALDPYSAFIAPENSAGPRAALEDHVVGIGVSIEPEQRGMSVVKVLTGGSAASAGIRPDDVLVSIDGRPLAGRSVDQAADWITGREGSQVVVGVLRGTQTYEVTLTRKYVAISTVSEAKMLDQNLKVAYMKLEQFSASSANEMERALWDMHRAGMQSLILDLRGNPGGLLTSAIEISDMFVPCGSIVSTRGRLSVDNSNATADYTQTWKVPLVVLVDENSASASEIFAAAIQDNGRGLIVGHKSYGKGTVQTQFTMRSSGAGIRLTTAKFYSPNGREMAGAGVTPDYVIEKVHRQFGSSDAQLEAARIIASSAIAREMASTSAKCGSGSNGRA